MKTMYVLLLSVCLVSCQNEQAHSSFVGYIEGSWHYVSALQSGQIEASFKTVGDSVKKGETLFEFDKEQQKARLEKASNEVLKAQAQADDAKSGARAEKIKSLKARLAQAQALFKESQQKRSRLLPLIKNGSVPKSRKDQVDANYQVAKASVVAAQEALSIARLGAREQAQAAANSAVLIAQANKKEALWQLSQRTIKAQTNASVEAVFHYTGEFVVAGEPLLAILPQGDLKARFFVPQASLIRLKKGQTVYINADGLERPVPAEISFIARRAEFTPPVIYSKSVREKLVFMVEARLSNQSDLKIGLPVDVSL